MRLRELYTSNDRTYSISGAIERNLTRSPGDGQLETLKSNIADAIALIAQLIELLYTKGALSKEELLSFIPGYEEAEED